MMLPESICIFGTKYKIVYEDLSSKDALGLCDTSKKTIFICSKSKCHRRNKEVLHTLLHEIGHALIEETSLGQTGLTPEVEEIIVNSYATILTQLFNIKLKKDLFYE